MKTALIDPQIVYEKDEFLVSFPDSIEVLAKGGNDEEDASDPSERKIGGIASTDSLDRQGEIVIQKGLDFSEFVNHGYFNDNHKQDTASVVGVPEVAKFIRGKGWRVEGYLLKGVPEAERIWKLAKSLDETPRRLGFSIEGKVLKREGNRIVKAKVRHVAITNSPVNTDCTWEVLAKSFCHIPEDECPGTCCAVGKAMKKGLSIGYVKNEGGRILVPEHLDGQREKNKLKKKLKKDTYECPKCMKGFPTERGLDGHLTTRHPGERIEKAEVEVRRSTELSRTDAIAHLAKLRPHLSEETRARIVDFVLAGGVK